jgi:hypothetical protein
MYTCHCGYEYGHTDHCPYCYCEAYEGTCDADYVAETSPLDWD